METRNESAKAEGQASKDLSEARSLELWRALESTMTPMEVRRGREAPVSRLNLLRRAILGVASPRASIKAFCQQCVGYEDLPRSVRECSARACPLWMKRPYQPKGGNVPRET